jgi:hypothetical protein
LRTVTKLNSTLIKALKTKRILSIPSKKMTIRGALQALAVEPFLIHEILEANRMTLVMDNRREAEAVVKEKRWRQILF